MFIVLGGLMETPTLLSYQQEAVNKIASTGKHRWLIADEMGLGKTPQAISVSNVWYKEGQKVVVICPSVVTYNWQDEWYKWDAHGRTVSVYTAKNKYIISPEVQVLVVSESLIANEAHRKKIVSFGAEVIIVDEAHHFKAWNAKRTRALIIDILTREHKVLLLTGTPITNKVSDLHTLYSICRPGQFGKFKEFQNKYMIHSLVNGVSTYYGVKNVAELKEKASEFTIRRLKKNVLTQLPDKTHTLIKVDIHKKLTDESLKFKSYIVDGKKVSNMATLRRDFGLAKLDTIKEVAANILENQVDYLVIFAHHKDVISGITSYLKIRLGNDQVYSITGDTTSEDKYELVRKFQLGKIKVLVCNIIAASVGITLTKAKTLLFAELDWTPANMAQAIDRVHRIGQNSNVDIFYVVGKDSIDEVIMNVLRSKTTVARAALGDRHES